MAKIKFLSVKEMDIKYRKCKDATGFTDGETIFFNLFYPDVFEEKYIEEDINYIFMHELIHTINMKTSEKK